MTVARLALNGHGSVLVKALNEAGITTFRALLDAGPAKIEDILNKAGLAAKTPVIPRWMAAAAEKVAQA